MKLSNKLEKGLIHYYFGLGKGKTSSLIGTIIRAMGSGLKPILIQFLKSHKEDDEKEGFFIGEIHFLKRFIPIHQFGSGNFIESINSSTPIDKELAKAGFDFAKAIISDGDYDLVCLDEVVNAVSLALIDLKDLIDVLLNKPEHVEIICTGSVYYREIREIADYITGFKAIDHPYNNGIEARKGIEY